MNNQSLLKYGEQYQKWLENTSVNLEAYQLNNEFYYLALYTSKFGSKEKGYAILFDNGNDNHASQSLLPHFSYTISHNNLLEGASERAKLDMSPWNKICDYIQDIINNNQIDSEQYQTYVRAHKTMKTVIDLQAEMQELWRKVKSITDHVQERGYFTEEDVQFLVHAVIQANLIEYKQIKRQYNHCHDFDVVYANRSKYRSYGKLYDLEILKELTSEVAEEDLKKSLESLSLQANVKELNETELYNEWLKTYEEQLQLRVKKAQKMLRYPPKRSS